MSTTEDIYGHGLTSIRNRGLLFALKNTLKDQDPRSESVMNKECPRELPPLKTEQNIMPTLPNDVKAPLSVLNAQL